MIRKQELIDAINDLNHDLLVLSCRVGDLENEIELLKRPMAKKAPTEKKTSGARRGRPPKNAKK